jgi:hypothetical protein
MTKQRKKPSPPKFKTEEEISKGKKARRDVGIPEISAKEMDKEEQDENAETTAEYFKSCGLIEPEPYKPWKALHKDAGKRDGAGRPLIFETAEQLQEAVNGYFEQTTANPVHKAEFKEGRIRSVAMKPLFTITGLCLYLGVGESFWRDTRKEKKDDPQFSAVFQWADAVITQNKFEGAALGFFKENIIAREMGLKDHVIQEVEDKRKQIDELFPTDVDPGGV